MGKYTDRVGARLRRGQKVSTARAVVRMAFVVLIALIAWWLYRRFLV